MSDVLIRDVPEEVIAAIDAHAAALGLSRNEYLRRRLRQDAERRASAVTVADLRRFETMFGDLADRDVMARAWS
jgi:hypothetical protein